MVWKVEVFAYFTFLPIVANVVEMGLEPIHKAVFCLSYILYAATFACEAIYYVGALAGDKIFF